MTAIAAMTVQQASRQSEKAGNIIGNTGVVEGSTNVVILNGTTDAGGTARVTFEVDGTDTDSQVPNILGQSSGDDRYKITVEKVSA